jgi:hypothetical protein
MEQSSFGTKKEINFINGLRDSFRLINRGRIFISSNPIYLAHVFYTHKFSMYSLTFQEQMSISINVCYILNSCLLTRYISQLLYKLSISWLRGVGIAQSVQRRATD